MKRILELKKEIGTLSKNSTNPFFKSAYLDLNDLLAAVEPLLQDNGLILLQPIKGNDVHSQIVDPESGNILTDSYMTIPDTIKDPQKLGGCVTYFRRYTLKSLLAISEEDDDGNLASKPVVKKEEPKKTLTHDNYLASLKLGKKQIQKVMDTFELTPDQLTCLTAKLK